MPRPSRLVLSEEPPEPVQIPLYKGRKELSREWWNGVLERRGLEIIHDPSGDFRPGSRWMWSDFLGDARDAFRPTVTALEEWPTGLVIHDVGSGRRYCLGEGRCFEMWPDMLYYQYTLFLWI